MFSRQCTWDGPIICDTAHLGRWKLSWGTYCVHLHNVSDVPAVSAAYLEEACTSQCWNPSNTAIQHHISEDRNFSVGHLLLSGQWTSHSWRTGLSCTRGRGGGWSGGIIFVSSATPLSLSLYKWLAPSIPLDNFTDPSTFYRQRNRD